jgi:hypothetical protein
MFDLFRSYGTTIGGRSGSLDAVELDDPAMSAGAAGMQLWLNFPIFSGFGQFHFYILPFEKQRFRTLSYQGLSETDQLV